jgi:hypothetical protein
MRRFRVGHAGSGVEVREASHKRSNGPLSGMRGVVIGAGLGVLAAKKVPPLLQKVGPAVQNAMLKYVMSHGAGATGQVAQGATDQVAQGATDQVPSTDQAAAGSPAT